MDPSSLAAIVAGAVVAAVIATFKVVTMFRRNGKEDRRFEASANDDQVRQLKADLVALSARVSLLEELRSEIREVRARLESIGATLLLIQWRLDHPGVSP